MEDPFDEKMAPNLMNAQLLKAFDFFFIFLQFLNRKRIKVKKFDK